MLKILGRKTSINVQRVMWAVGELGLAHVREDVGGPFGKTDTDDFGRLNPNRLVPVMNDDGFILWESTAIVRYLAEAYGTGSLAPDDIKQRALAQQWVDWCLSTVYDDLIPRLFVQFVRVTAADRNMAAVEAAAKRTGERLAILDDQLAGRAYILGDHLTCADMGVGTLMYRYFTMPIARPSLPNVEAWYQRLSERPAYREHVMIDWQAMKVPGA